jgi:small GTP-binding protein
MNYDEKCQLLVIGDSTVGKTSILQRYVDSKFSQSHLATVGIDYFTKDITINNKIIRVKVWDTAGQERYKSLTNAFFRNAQGIMLVFDVSNMDSFDNLKFWIENIKQNIGESDGIKKIVIGNKSDLQREVKREEAEQFAKNNDIEYFETSAKLNTGINEAVQYLVGKVLVDKLPPEYRDSMRLTTKLNSKSEKQGGGCGC